jgi:hypothetical protein
MRVIDSRDRQVGLIGVGAGLALVVLLVLQSQIGTGLLSARTVTSKTTAAESTFPGAYNQVSGTYANHLLMLQSRSASELVGEYGSNATIEWKGIPGLSGIYAGNGNIGILLRSFVGRFVNLSVSNESQTLGPRGDDWVVNSTFDIHGYSTVVGRFNATIAAQDSYVHAAKSWLIANETWNYLKYDEQYFVR